MTCPNQIPNFGQMPQGDRGGGGGGVMLRLALTDTLLQDTNFYCGDLRNLFSL